MLRLSAACILLIALVDAIPIDNGVVGDPEIQCGSASIGLSVATQNAFGGHVYVRGHSAEVARSR